MKRTGLLRGALYATALSFVLVACATPQEADQTPRDVRVVELSDEAAEKIAALVAERIAPPPRVVASGPRVAPRVVRAPHVAAPTPHQPPHVQPRRVQPVTFGPAPVVATEEVNTAAKEAVDSALEWLARHQAPDGSWRAHDFAAQCVGAPCSGAGEAAYTTGLTGLALQAFLRNGETHQSGKHSDVVKKGLRYLSALQDSEGCFGPRTTQHFQYNHALASLAVIENYALTGSIVFRESAQRAVEFVRYSQNPYLGWRYGVRDGDNDTSMTCWMVQVLAAGKAAGLEVDAGAFRGALAWVDKMTEPEYGRVGYNRRGGPPARTMEAMDAFPAEYSEAMTAAGLLIRLHAGQESVSSELIGKSADLLAKKPPLWDTQRGTNDFYYWQLGASALRRIGGYRWEAWRNSLHAAVTRHQRDEPGSHVHGSWDPVDAWSGDGGRIYSTASLCIALQELLQ